MTTEDEARLAGIRERCKSPPWQEHDIGFLLRVIDTARARIAQLDADYVQAAHDAGKMIDEREAKVKRLEAEVEALKRGFATPASEASTSEGAHASVPGNAWDVIIRDRDEWKRRAEQERTANNAERAAWSTAWETLAGSHEGQTHPSDAIVATARAMKKRAEAAELRLSQVENTIRGRMSHYDSYAVSTASIPSDRYVAGVLADLLVDLGFEPEPGQNEKSAELPKEPGA